MNYHTDKLSIVMFHNYYQHSGGEDVATETDINILQKAGHKISFIQEDNDQIKNFSALEKLKLFLRTAWNQEQYYDLKSRLEQITPDLLHVQNFFPLFSPSVHAVAKSLNIPNIQHLHNFRLGCLNGYLLRNENICEVCVGKNPWQGVAYRCYRNSVPASLAVWNLITYNRWRKTWEKDVDAFITPSQFAAQKLIEIGIPENRLYVKPNVTPDPLLEETIPPFPQEPTFLFIGRLSPEKGVMNLLNAWEKLAKLQWKLNIVGDGEQRVTLEQFVTEKSLTNVYFLGYQSKTEVVKNIKTATAIVVPSQWYETFGRVVIEAFACGRPVLASNLGALAELIQDHETGFLISHNTLENWVEFLEWSGNHPLEIKEMGRKARQIYQEKYTPEVNYQQIMRIYQRILS